MGDSQMLHAKFGKPVSEGNILNQFVYMTFCKGQPLEWEQISGPRRKGSREGVMVLNPDCGGGYINLCAKIDTAIYHKYSF